MQITKEQYLELIRPPAHHITVKDSGIVVIDESEVHGDIHLGMVLLVQHAETEDSWPQMFHLSLDQARELIARLCAGEAVASDDT